MTHRIGRSTVLRWARQLACVLLITAPYAAAQEPTADAAIARARAAIAEAAQRPDEKTPPPEVTRRIDQAARDFDHALADAAAFVTAAARTRALAEESTSIDAKLLVIAVDRRARPEIYADILRIYVQMQPRQTRSGRAPRVSREHAIETYRLAWEFFLLSPRPANTLPAFEESAADAIAIIGNPRSASTLVHMVRVATQPTTDADAGVTQQRRALHALAGMPGPRGAAAIAEALALIERQPRRQLESEWDPVDFLVKRIDALPQPKRAVWLSVLSARKASPAMQRLAKQLRATVR